MTNPSDDPRETTGGYSPPEKAEHHEWWWLAAKFSVCWAIIDLLCGALGMPSPSTGVIAASFLVTSPPVAAVKTTVWRVLAMFIGAAAGAGGAYWGLATDGEIPTTFFILFGVLVGAMTTYTSALAYAAVIGVVVAAQGVSSDTSVPTIVWETGLQLVIGCAVGLAVIWSFEKLRAVWTTRMGYDGR